MNSIRGRGAQYNPKNRFEKLHIEVDEYDYPDEGNEEIKVNVNTSFLRDNSKSIIAENNSYDVGFDYSFNPYRGCEHGCVYCYARPTHEFLGFSSGLDFETKIMVKEDAPELLRKHFMKKNYKPDVIMFSGNTDCYQPVERKLKLIRESLKVCNEFGNPVSIITKNSLILRDIDILKEMTERNLVLVMLSITTLNRQLTEIMEPRTSIPERRLNTIKILAENNIPVGINIAPVIPGLTDKEIPALIEAASKAGAKYAGHTMLRLPYAVKDLFLNWLNDNMPDRAGKVINQIMQIRNGKLNSSEFGKRFTGEGELADTIHSLYEVSCKKFGLNKKVMEHSFNHFKRKSGKQLELFD